MKTLLISLMSLLAAVVLTGSFRMDYLDFEDPDLDITWDDIDEDLWP